MKIKAIIIFLFSISSMISTHAQEIESVQQLISDTTIQNKSIPFVSISSALEQSSQMIQDIIQSMTSSDGVKKIDSLLSSNQIKIDTINAMMSQDFLKISYFIDFERKSAEVGKFKSEMEETNNTLQKNIDNLESKYETINQLEQIWENTRKVQEYDKLTPSIRSEIDSLSLTIQNTKQDLQTFINDYLETQIKVNNQLSLVQEMEDKITLKKEEQEKNLFTRSAPPLWDLLKSTQLDAGTSEFNTDKIIELRKNDVRDYYTVNKTKIYLALLYLVLIQIFFYYLKLQIKKTEFEKELDINQNSALRLLAKNWLTALVLGLTIAFLTLPEKPLIIDTLLFLVSLVPLYYLFISLVEKRYIIMIRMLFLIFFLTLFLEPYREVIIVRRIFLIGLNLLTLVWIIIIVRRGLDHVFKIKFIAAGAKLISLIFAVFLTVSLIANVWGSFRYSLYVTYAISGSLFYGLLYYLFYLILLGITTAFLFNRWANQLHIVQNHKLEIERKITSALRVIIILFFTARVLRSFHVDTKVSLFLKGIIEHPLNIGNFIFTFGDILLFMIIILISRWISNFIVFVLDEQVYYKTKKKKDVAASISALVRFSIITIGFLIGVVAIGFELDKLTLLISAFGVGIGFGLQNIFNNLVSGIIMVFERPLQVGDVIEVGQLIGTVRKIGIRSSIVRTFDGSEVIVPNGNLISNELINWTHSDMQRRLILKVGVAYGTEPEQVISILVKVAENNPNIMEDPKPYAIFTEFADSSLNFELRCWTDNFDDWLFTMSEMRLQVNQALKEAGITIPFPQRDVHIYSTDNFPEKRPGPKKDK